MVVRADKWPCPECGGKTRVYGSDGMYRRRKCKGCGHRFETKEVLSPRQIRHYKKKTPIDSTSDPNNI